MDILIAGSILFSFALCVALCKAAKCGDEQICRWNRVHGDRATGFYSPASTRVHGEVYPSLNTSGSNLRWPGARSRIISRILGGFVPFPKRATSHRIL